MNLRATFNRLATGLGLAVVMGLASAQPTVPPGSNPDYLVHIYRRLTTGSTPPDFSRVTLSSSITDRAPIPDNAWLQNLKAMTPAEAEAAVQGCLESLCEHKYPLLSENEKFIARMMVLEAMFHDGLNASEFRTYSQFLSRFQPDHGLQEQEAALINILADTIADSPEYRDLKQKLIPAADITSQNAAEQFQIRQDFIIFVTREVRRAFGRESTPTYLDLFPTALNGTAAVTISRGSNPEIESHRAILFNYNARNTHHAEMLLELVAHEARHSLDFDDRDQLYRGELGSHDSRFSHIVTIDLNNNLYIPLCATSSYGSVSCPEQYEWYKNQYVERSAEDFAAKLLRGVREKLNSRRQNSVSRGFEPEKFELPA